MVRSASAATPRRYADFLPGAQGLADRRSSPLAGALILAVACMFGSLIGWMAWAEVEQVVKASGRVEPISRVKLINHPQGGRVAKLHVQEGQKIVAGDVLVTFDGELRQGEMAELQGRWQLKVAVALRLAAEVEGSDLQLPPGLAGARPDLLAEQAELLRARRAAQADRKATLTSSIQRRQSELSTLDAERRGQRASLALLRQQAGAVQELVDKGLYPKLKQVTLAREVAETGGMVSRIEQQMESARAAITEAETRLDGLSSEWHSQLLSELSATTAERDRLGEALARQQVLLRGLVVKAPVDGIVQEISVTAIGQSLPANQPLMKIVPTGDGLVIQARVANEDIGYIHPGQTATVKVRAFDFLRHGAMDGTVDRIAPDARSEPETGAARYDVTVHTGRSWVGTRPGENEVVPGMVVDVELRVGERTILSYLTDRILKLREDVFREG